MTGVVRLLQAGDEVGLDSFLEPHTPFVYFLRSNLKRGGLRFQGRPYQADYFGAFEGNRLIGVLAHTWLGNIILFAPHSKTVPLLVDNFRSTLRHHPREITGFLGPLEQVRNLLSVLGVSRMNLRQGDVADDVLYTLVLGSMVLPSCLNDKGWNVRRALAVDAETLILWRHDFYVEALGDEPGEKTLSQARQEIERRIKEGDLFVLEVQGRVVSFCGAGGFLNDWKNVGPVWTPPDLRGRGYACAVTAGALAFLQEEGATHAVLFSSNSQAQKAYAAIGFQPAGKWGLEFLIKPVLQL